MLELSDAPTSRWHLVVIGRALAGESGLLTIASVVPDDPSIGTDRLDGLRRAIEEYLSAQRVAALVKVESEADVGDGLISLVKDEILPATRELDALLAETRFPARVQVVCRDGDPFSTIRRHAREADLLFLGLRSIGEEASLDDYAAYYASLATNTDGLPPAALVHAGEDVDLHRLFAGV